MLIRPSIGELVVLSSSVSAEVFFVKCFSRRFIDQVGCINLSSFKPLPVFWFRIKRLYYLSHAQAMAFYRWE